MPVGDHTYWAVALTGEERKVRCWNRVNGTQGFRYRAVSKSLGCMQETTLKVRSWQQVYGR